MLLGPDALRTTLSAFAHLHPSRVRIAKDLGTNPSESSFSQKDELAVREVTVLSVCMSRYLFVKTGWAREYRDLDADPPTSQHGWLVENAGHEAFNFKVHDGKVYGYFPVASNSGGPDLRRIDPSSAGDKVEDVTVVWTATDPDHGGTKVVGWYRHATVFGKSMSDGPWIHSRFKDSPGGRCGYVCTANETNAQLIPVQDRVEWPIPPREVPQANIRYPTREDYSDLDAPWALKILERIQTFATGLPDERRRRDEMWSEIQKRGGPESVSPSVVRELGAYGGASGTWADSERTQGLTTNGCGVTVSVLHTGRSYPDDLSEASLLYHYPSTNRPRGRDVAEIEATKNAARLGLPILALIPSSVPDTHKIRRGWVKSWDDESRTFLIVFDLAAQPPLGDETDGDSEPFEPLAPPRQRTRRLAAQRTDQPKFKFAVVKRYGPSCAVCDFAVPEALDAAHIVPDKNGGSIDPRNGLVLCATHHRSYDAGLFEIEPGTLLLHPDRQGPDLEALRVSHKDLSHLRKKPGDKALEWRWRKRPTNGV
jgi:putative restriction endonuclease